MTPNATTISGKNSTSKTDNNVIPNVSVIVPVHNAEAFIKQTLSALLKKAPEDIEIILIFDNCSDNSYEVAKAFLKNRKNLTYQLVSAENGSTALSRNQGIERARGEYVAFVDHDDIVDSAVYTRMLDFVRKSKLDVVRFGYSIDHEDGTSSLVEMLPDRKNYPFKGMFIWNGMFKREFLNKHNIRFLPGYGEDYEFNLALLACNATEGRIETNSVYYCWRHHGENLHKRRNAKDFIERIESILINHEDYLKSDEEVAGNLVIWVAEYINHLSSGEHRKGIAEAYTKSKAVYELMNSGHQTIVPSASVRRLLRSSSVEEFLSNKAPKYRKKFKQSGFLRNVLAKLKYVPFRLRSVYINAGGLVATTKFLISRLIIHPIINFLGPYGEDNSVVKDRITFLKNHPGKKSLLFVFPGEHISGGLISIYSIASKLRENNIEVVMVGAPGHSNVPRNRLFPNTEVTIPWKKYIQSGLNDFEYVMLPEVKTEEFLALLKLHEINFTNTTLNILNQNNQLMPAVEIIDGLRPFFKDVTMTTAHLRYSTQEMSNKWGVPIKHISTYLSYRDYIFQPFEEKRNSVLFSVDYHPLKGKIIESVARNLPDYQRQIIMGLSYKDYKILARRSKFSVTFGEGMDNYFIEPFFSGGIGVAVYNPDFMPEEFINFENVFTSYSELAREIDSFMNRVLDDDAFRETVWRKNFEILSTLYDDRVYDRKISEYINGERDFYPRSAVQN